MSTRQGGIKVTDDIVTRLRNAEAPRDGSELLCDLADEAADEIERLRAEVQRLTTSTRYADEVYILTEEGEKLWDKIQAVRDE